MLDLPDMEGDVLSSLIRRKGQLSKVSIILVCYPVPRDLERASRCGANAWVTKPIHPYNLLHEVGKLLNIPTRLNHRTNVNGIVHCLWFSGMLQNISVSGILCETDMLFDKDELIIGMSFVIGSHEIIADGKFVRSVNLPDGRYNYGVQFINIEPEYQEVIADFVETKLKTA
jgi:CheY-like chemotaxis protein